MAGQYGFLMGVAFGSQAARGTVDPTIAALTGALDESDGLVLGDPEAGEGETGLSFKLASDRRDKAVVTGSFSRSFADYIRTLVDTFDFTIPLKGAGTSTPSVDADYQLAAGVEALLECAGLAGAAWAGGTGWEYTPANADVISAKLWFGDQGTNSVAVVLKDIEASDLELTIDSGEIGKAAFSLGGTVESVAIEATPTFDYGLQNTVSAPSVESVGYNWGLTAAARGFETLTVSINNQTEETKDSNAAGGLVQRQTGREITATATIYAEDAAELDFEFNQLEETDIANAEQWDCLIGTAGEANAYEIIMPDPECTEVEPKTLANSQAWALAWIARSATANAEFSLILR